ncbi:MAG: hypothetical protein IH614_16885 [Desulfuromonadales bacterium]|nr:hypothetical protein [Desulfuromonadales bacterium]
MGKIIEFPDREKRIAKLLREQLPFELPAEEIEELATALRQAAERVDVRKSFNLFFPATCSPAEMESIARQVEGMMGEMLDVIKAEEGEIFSLIVRNHLLLHELRRLVDNE